MFTHSANPMEAYDWLRAVERQLNLAECNDLEKVLYASGQLQGAAQTWWESYQAARPNNAPAITWQEFCRDFKARHINEGMIELKQEEFRSLRMGSMTIAEYHDTFEQLARYALNEVREDADKQCLFMKGLYYDLRLQLAGNTYPTFQALVNRAIVLDDMRKSQDRKRRMQGQSSGSNNHQRFGSQQGSHQSYQGLVSQWNCDQHPQHFQNQQQSENQCFHFQHRNSYQQQGGQQTPRSRNCNDTPRKNNAPNTPNRCFYCGKEGHMSYNCPENHNP